MSSIYIFNEGNYHYSLVNYDKSFKVKTIKITQIRIFSDDFHIYGRRVTSSKWDFNCLFYFIENTKNMSFRRYLFKLLLRNNATDKFQSW